MDAPKSTPQPPAAPQIRSRITVVCAECKRLKLKCDRRTPCGSCTKRDTVVRCIYSPAAAEKVDLHSLNNRLIQTETALALLTQGKTPPPFQSSYPGAQLPEQRNDHHYHHHHDSFHHRHTQTPAYVPPAPISIPTADLTAIWLAPIHCVPEPSPSHEASSSSCSSSSSSYIKLEPSQVDLLSFDDHDIDFTNTYVDLPPLSIYYATTPSTSTTQHQYTYPASSPTLPFPHSQREFPTSTHAQHPSPSFSIDQTYSTTPAITSPGVTPALLSQIPPPSTRTRLLAAARAALPHLSAPWVPWSRFGSLAPFPCTSSNSVFSSAKSRRRKDRDQGKDDRKKEKTDLARTVFFGGRPSGSTSQADSAAPFSPIASDSLSPRSTEPTLPLFSALCYLLAIGALYNARHGDNTDAHTDPEYLYALGVQAAGVWDEWRRPVDTDAGEEKLGEVKLDRGLSSEEDEIDALIAGLLRIAYVVTAGKGKTRGGGTEKAFSLIGKLVNDARALGLGRDPDSSTDAVNGFARKAKNSKLRKANRRRDSESDDGYGGEREAEKERRRMIWWEVMFYDMFVSDAFGQNPLITLTEYSTHLPACAGSSSNSDLIANSTNSSSTAKSHSHSGATKSSKYEHDSFHDEQEAAEEDADDEEEIDSDGDEEDEEEKEDSQMRTGDVLYVSVRCRLTQLTQTLKHQLAHPSCGCCGSGYTLDRALKMEGDVRTWIGEVQGLLSLGTPRTDDATAHHPPSPSSAYQSSDSSSPFHLSSPPTTNTWTADETGKLHMVTPTQQQCSTASNPTPTQANPIPNRDAVLSAELAIVANRLIIAIYLPFLKPSAQRHPHTAGYSMHPWSPASRATVDAAQGVVCAARVLHRLVRGQGGAARGPGAMMMMMDEYLPLDKAVLDAVVICTHAGILYGAKKSQKGAVAASKAVMEDVGVGMEVLCALGAGRGYGEMGRVVGALRRRLVAFGVSNAEAREDESQLKRKHDQVEGDVCREAEAEVSAGVDMLLDMEQGFEMDGGSAEQMDPSTLDFTSASMQPQQPQQRRPSPQQQFREMQRRARSQSRQPSPQRKEVASRLKVVSEKDKKHKKGQAAYPSFGIRIRPGKETPPWVTRRGENCEGESQVTDLSQPQLITSIPLDTASKFAAPQTQPQLPHSTMMQDNTYRSRSSSMTQDPRTRESSQLEFSYGAADQGHTDIHTMQRRRFSLHELEQQQLANPPFTPSPTTVYNPSQQPSRAGSFDHHPGYEQQQQHGSFDHSASASAYASASSPYQSSSTSLSGASSPYASTNGGGPPPTPTTFGSGSALASHHPSPPTFGQSQATNPSPQAYYQMGNGYDTSSYDGHVQQSSMVINGIPADTSVGDHGNIHVNSVSGTPIYEKSAQQMYDVKPSVDLLSQMQYQQNQNQTQSLQHHSMPMNSTSQPQSWPPVQVMPQTSQSIGEQGGAYQWPGGNIFYT